MSDRVFSEMLEHVAQAIKHVVKAEVTIIDHQYRRLAATGIYASQVGQCVNSHSAFAKAMKQKTTLLIASPGKDPLCSDCEAKGQCAETAEVCCPILIEGEAAGAIGLIAFTAEQRQSLLNSQDDLKPFIESMASLIGIKIKEMQQAEEIELLSSVVDMPVLVIDRNGLVVRANTAARREWPLTEDYQIGQLLSKSAVAHIWTGESKTAVTSKGKHCTYELEIKRLEAQSRAILLFRPIQKMIGDANRYLESQQLTGFEDIIGDCTALEAAKSFAKKAAKAKATVLILGESGTGKELFARAIHSASERNQQVFLAVNCAAIPESLMESELFGYEPGTFTGAAKGGRIGRFEQANRGTLFLDEIGDLPLHLQAKLLRVLQEGSITKLGGQREIPIDVRIICATHRNLEQMVQEGSFRQDLYYRINVLPLEIPPLRERQEDLARLADFFAKKSAGRLGKPFAKFNHKLLAGLCRYSWPGNIRELENTIEYMVNVAQTETLTLADLPRKISEALALPVHERPLEVTMVPQMQTLKADAHEKLKMAIAQNGTDKHGVEKSCEQLGISRATYYRKVKQFESQNENKMD